MNSSDPICLTLDVDWACEEVLEAAVERLQKAGVAATFFATHASPALSAAESDQIEIGLHPNFNDCGGDFEAPMALVKEAYPDAVGARSHSLYFSAQILELYIRHGMRYESNIFLLEHAGLHPVLRFRELVSVPFIWSDDKQLELGRRLRGDAVPLEVSGLKVFNFHPIHLFLNTRDPAHYESSRPFHRDPDGLRGLVNDEVPGVGTVFDEVLEAIAERGLRTARMRDVAASVPTPPG
jgi:hypothetical protein